MKGERLLSIISKDYELRGNGKWFHSVEHDSLVIDAEKGFWWWNSRGLKGNEYLWLTLVKGFSSKDAFEYLKSLGELSDYTIVHHTNKEDVIVYPKLVDVFYEEGQRNDRSYWYKRGLTDETIQRFKLGYNDGWYTIPIYQDGIFRNFQLRREEPQKMIRAYYKDVGRLLFNSDILKFTDEIYITEGPTDCLRLLQENIPAISHNAGSEGWNEDWYKYFVHQKVVHLIYDNDNAGVNGGKIVARNLGLYRTLIYTFPGFSDKYDICDFFNDGHTKEEFLEKVKTESKYSFQT